MNDYRKSKFPRKVFLKKENNELLDGYSYLKKADDTYIEVKNLDTQLKLVDIIPNLTTGSY